jgi:hypothetical protein
MTVAEIRDNEANLPDLVRAHHLPHLAHHRIGRVAVVHRADPAACPSHADDLLALLDGHRHRLFAQNVKARLEERLGDLEMGRVRRGHRHEIHAIVAVPLALQHLAPVAIGAVSRNAQPLGIGASLRRVRVERACHQDEIAVRLRTQPVRRTDLAAFAATDHAPVQSCHGRSPRTRWIAR